MLIDAGGIATAIRVDGALTPSGHAARRPRVADSQLTDRVERVQERRRATVTLTGALCLERAALAMALFLSLLAVLFLLALLELAVARAALIVALAAPAGCCQVTGLDEPIRAGLRRLSQEAKAGNRHRRAKQPAAANDAS
jgi:hypothetical protein